MSGGGSSGRPNEESADDRVDALQVEAMLFDVPAVYARDTDDTCISCRICLDNECAEDDRLLSPCRCSGTMKYVHASCLDRWRGFARRTQSVVGCDQCGAEYRFASTPLMRLLASRTVLWAATALAFVTVALIIGLIGSALMRHYQPELFVGSHPYLVQSSQYRPTLDHVPLRLRALQEERHASYAASGLENFWDYMLGPIEDAYVDDDDEAYATLYSLGIFHPSVLVQLVQGLVQRSIETLTLPTTRRIVPPYVLRHTSTTHVRDDPSTGGGAPHLPSATAPRAPTPPPSIHTASSRVPVPPPPVLEWRARLVWYASLGLALLGITSVPNLLFLASVLGPFRLGAPFTVVGYTEHTAQHTQMPAHARIVWESINVPGMLLLAAVAWGLLRLVLLLHRGVRMAACLIAAHVPQDILDYDERTRGASVALPDVGTEGDDADVWANAEHVGHAFLWAGRLLVAASRPALGIRRPLLAWMLGRVGM
ncbi:hypothetical protein CBS9595_003005 [Malassezia furfur]|nr:hypothetical protein CBS9595_003005 [Malassezia furfur]